MSILTDGTQIYFIDPDFDSSGAGVREVECVTAFTPGGSPADQIPDDCLAETERKFRRGRRTPSAATMGVSADPENDSHVRLHELSESDQADGGEILSWAVGWSDGTAAPTLDSNGDFELPTTRTWFVFQGYVADFPFDFQINSIVQTQISIQRSGGSAWIRKST